jgi:PAS domain-containing protein
MTLEELTMYLNELIDNSPMAILVLDPNHRVQMCNPAFERLFQYDREELMQANLEDLITTGELTSEAVEIWKKVSSWRKDLCINQASAQRWIYCGRGNSWNSSANQEEADWCVRNLSRCFAAKRSGAGGTAAFRATLEIAG